MNLIAQLVSGVTVIRAVIFLIVCGLIFWLLWWLVDYCALPEPFAKIARIVLAIAAVIVIINILLWLAGVPLVGWP